jgi:aminopeptidase N
MVLHLDEARARKQVVGEVSTTVDLDLTSTESYGLRARLEFTSPRPGASTFVELTGATDLVVVRDGEQVEASYDGERIALPGLGATNTVEVSARMPYVIDGDGMTVTVDPADDERYVCSFTAMDIAHKVIPCFDQPDIKTRFSVSVTAPAHWSVLANGRHASTTVDGDTARWEFETTPPISTYLFFITGGPYASVTWDEPYDAAPGGTLPFGWHARASQERELRRDADELRRVTSACFAHYTSVFNEPYAFADFQQVFTPGLNWGAMEFPGCVAYRDEMLTQGAPTALQRQSLVSTIAHEMAHMWFGDLVTMTWWEDSWLNESFADFMGYDVADVAAGYADSWTGAALLRKPTGYRADLRRSSHPVAESAEQMPDADTAFANFDMITYAKGNAVLRQLGTWLGDDFVRGVNAHLSAHPFGNADLADFLAALDGATDRDVRSWADAWLRSTGFDTIEVTRDGDVPVLTRHGSRPHRFTVAAYDDDMRRVDTVWVDLADEPVRLEQLAGRVVVPNAGDETFAAIRPDEESWTAITRGLGRVEENLTRALLWWVAIDRTQSGGASIASLVELVEEQLADERHPVVLEAVLREVMRTVRVWGSPDGLQDLTDALARVARAALDSGVEALRPAASRALASLSSDASFLAGWLESDDPSTRPEQEVRWAIVHRLTELGDPSRIGTEEERDRSVAGRHAALRARAAIPTPEAKEQAWAQLMSGTLSSHELAAVAAGFWGREQADLVTPYLERYLVDGLELGVRSGQAMGGVIGADAFPWLPLQPQTRRDLRERLAAALTGDVPTVLAREWNDCLDDLDRAIAASGRAPLR